MQLLLCYFLPGMIFSIGLIINGGVRNSRRIAAVGAVILAWPIIVLVSPESFIKSIRDNYVIEKRRDFLAEELASALNSTSSRISPKLERVITRTIDAGEDAVPYFSAELGVESVLQEFWGSNIPPLAFTSVRSARLSLQGSGEPSGQGVSFQGRAQEAIWLVGFTGEFIKSVSKVDTKLRGRILDALNKISAAPMVVVGDTLKPLSATLTGMWRYRIGDYRLVYIPDRDHRKVTLLYFGSRTEIYSKL